MLAPLLRIRIRALTRGTALLLRHEPLAIVTALGLMAGVCVYLLRAASVERCLALAGLSVAMVSLAHGTRVDERFLRTAGAPHRALFAAEYGAASVPASILLLASAFPWTAVLPFAAVLAAPFPSGKLRAARSGRGAALPVPGPADAFEWKAGLRSAAPGVVTLYAIAALLARLPAAPLLGLAVLALIAAGMYQDGEGWPMLEALDRSPARFLRRKIAHALGHWGVLAAPLCILFIILHRELWPVLAAVLAGCAMLVTGAVLLKYALWHEGRLPTAAAMLGVLAFAASIVVPPVAIFLLHRFWRMALRNLDPYLYAFD